MMLSVSDLGACLHRAGTDPNVRLCRGRGSATTPPTRPLCRPAGRADREAYADALVASMSEWFDRSLAIDVVLEARNEDLALLHLKLVEGRSAAPYTERDSRALGEAIGRLGARLGVRLPGNFQLVPDFSLIAGRSLRLVKPLQRRFWLRSAAIADADALALELHDAFRVGAPG